MRGAGMHELLDHLETSGQNPELDGPIETSIESFCSLGNPKAGSITWVKRLPVAPPGPVGCVVIAPEGSSLDDVPGASAVIAVNEPKAAFFGALARFWPRRQQTGVASSAVVLGELCDGVSVGEHCYIGPYVRVGAGTIIEHGVTICCPASIGESCLIHSGAVIGTDGFGFYMEDGIPRKVEHFGGVTIGNRVEVGANTCIDRGTIDDTVIEDDVKIDNLVHIGHNDIVGARSLIIAGSVVGGSTVIGPDSYLAPNSTVRNQLTLSMESTVGLGAVLNRDLGQGEFAIADMAKIRKVPARMVHALRDSGMRGMQR